MANETVVELEFDPIFGTKAKRKLVKESEQLGEKSGKGFKEEFSQELRGLGNRLKASLAGAAKSAGALAAGFAVIGGSLVLNRAIKESSQLQDSLIGLKSVAGAFGISADRISQTAQSLAADGLIPLEDVTASLKNLIVNFDGDLNKAVQTFDALKNAAAFNRQGQLSLGEAIRGASEGLKNDLSIKVDNAGVTKNLSVLQKEYAASIGTTIGKLSEQQKAQAEYVGILREASIFQGDYNKLTQTFSGAITGLQTSIRFLLARFGDLITRSPAVIALINGITSEIRRLTESLGAAGGDGFKNIILGALEVGKAVNKYIIKPFSMLINVFDLIGNAFNAWVGFVLAGVGKIAQGIVSILPDSMISDRLQAAVDGFAAAGFEQFATDLAGVAESLRTIGNTELADSIDTSLSRMSERVAAATPNLMSFNKQLKDAGTNTVNLANKGKMAAKAVNDSIGRALTKTASLGIQALTKSLLLGQKGFENFGKQIAGILGSMAIQLGETLIFTGLGIEALKTLGGAAAIAAGAGLIALGTILKSFSGGEGAGGAGVGGGGGEAFSGAIQDTPLEEQLQEQEEPDTKVSVQINGNVFDSEETGIRIAQILEEASLNQNVKVVGFA